LFNVSAFYVSQVNFHVSPFMRKAEGPHKTSYYWSMMSHCEEDIRHRARKLAKLGVLPRFFGVNMTSVFKQKYHGDVTMVPSFTPMESIGLKAVMNPSPEDIRGYITGGDKATWPRINRIRFMMRTELCLRSCVAKLRTMLMERPKSLRPEHHSLELSSLDSCTSLATLTKRKSLTIPPPPPLLAVQSSPDRPYTDADEFGLLSDHDDDYDEDENDADENDENENDEKDSDPIVVEDETSEEDMIKKPNSIPFPNRRSKRKKSSSSSVHNAQLRWELKMMEDQVSDLRNENIELRTRLSDIASLAEVAVTKSPSQTTRRKNTC
jgi:hypothetical protein